MLLESLHLWKKKKKKYPVVVACILLESLHLQ
jgi:hypothetical protein